MKTSCSLTASVTRLLRIRVSTVKALEDDAYKWITQFIGVVDVNTNNCTLQHLHPTEKWPSAQLTRCPLYLFCSKVNVALQGTAAK